jgi:hypothetical protein
MKLVAIKMRAEADRDMKKDWQAVYKSQLEQLTLEATTYANFNSLRSKEDKKYVQTRIKTLLDGAKIELQAVENAEGDKRIIMEANAKYIREINKRTGDALVSVYAEAFGSIASLWEQGTAEWKAFAAAQALLDGYLAVQSIWAAGQAEIFSGLAAKVAATAAVAAMTAANVAKIASTPIPDSKLSNTSGGGSYSYSAPAINPVRYLQQGTQNVSMNANTANLTQATPQTVLQVYVREQDIRAAGTKSSVIENGLRY